MLRATAGRQQRRTADGGTDCRPDRPPGEGGARLYRATRRTACDAFANIGKTYMIFNQSICKVCRAAIERPQGHRGPLKTYCSAKCKTIGNGRIAAPAIRNCDLCGGKFTGSRKHKKCDKCRGMFNRSCSYCGSRFVGFHAQQYCSVECRESTQLDPEEKREHLRSAWRRKNHVRRARLKMATIELFSSSEIFERDGYTCQKCMNPTDPSSGHNNNEYPTLDHIIPLSKGGPHSRWNSQCLCRRCNMDKSSTFEMQIFRSAL